MTFSGWKMKQKHCPATINSKKTALMQEMDGKFGR